jgi:hypothetical protein
MLINLYKERFWHSMGNSSHQKEKTAHASKKLLKIS